MKRSPQFEAIAARMRVVLDTNILISALIQPAGRSAGLLEAWDSGQFELLYCHELVDEFRRVTRSGKLAALISVALAGRLLNDVRNSGILVRDLPQIDVSPDPWVNFLLAMCCSGSANYLVTGDKADLLAIGKYRTTRIVSVRAFAEMLEG